MGKKNKTKKVEEQPEEEEGEEPKEPVMERALEEGEEHTYPKVSEPQFINNGEAVKVKLIDGEEFRWITVKKGQTVTIPRKIALANKFEEVQ